MYDTRIFQSNLKQLLRSHGFSQRDLAEHLETTPTTVSRYLSGNRAPDLSVMVEIASFFNVSLDDLVGIEPPNKPRRAPDEVILESCYNSMTDADRNVLWALLDRYMSPEQRLIIRSMQDSEILSVV